MLSTIIWVGTAIYERQRNGWYVYVGFDGKPLLNGFHLSELQITVIVDEYHPDKMKIHFETDVCPSSWTTHPDPSMTAWFTTEGSFISGCANYKVQPETITYLRSLTAWNSPW